ncbi:hypothetical protein CDD83_1987 [Cordyceps sp. RAO-2017]|nr:hypothetical protein CDD83_1987 [Cordyceps sp. RAO-2017]
MPSATLEMAAEQAAALTLILVVFLLLVPLSGAGVVVALGLLLPASKELAQETFPLEHTPSRVRSDACCRLPHPARVHLGSDRPYMAVEAFGNGRQLRQLEPLAQLSRRVFENAHKGEVRPAQVLVCHDHIYRVSRDDVVQAPGPRLILAVSQLVASPSAAYRNQKKVDAKKQSDRYPLNAG